MRRHTVSLSFLLISLLTACATKPAGSPTPAAPAAAANETRPPLALEQARLAELFRGTPVAFTLQPDGSLRATVPRQFSFDAGAIKVKPPLAAVLDRLAKGQLQAASRMRVSAPSDPDTRSPSLARERALSVRDYLAGRGIAATRLQASGAAQADQVEIVVSEVR
jgi:outer membrane protein OmpA-like peptidoglycan-associated protein